MSLGRGLSAALLEYAGRQEGARLHAERVVGFTVALDAEGNLKHVLHHPKPPKGERPHTALLPREAKLRSNGSAPLLISDNPQYVLGWRPGATPKQQKDTDKKHADYLALLDKAASIHPDAALIAQAARRLQRSDFPVSPDEGETVTFTVDGRNPHLHPAVQAFWIQHQSSEGKPEFFDAVTGEPAPLAGNSPAIKGITGGKAILSYQSTNASTAQRYGMTHLGVSEANIQAIAAALTALAQNPATSYRPAGTDLTVLHWLSEDSELDPWTMLNAPTEQAVHEALTAFEQGTAAAAPETRVMTAVTRGAAARLLVLDYAETSLEEATRHSRKFVEQTGGLPLWQLNAALGDLAGKTGDDLASALVMHALLGRPLPRRLLLLLTRKWNKNLTYTRAEAALLRLTLGWKEHMDIPEHLHNPYWLGAYAAHAGQFHQRANPGTGVTITDRFLRMMVQQPARGYGEMSGALAKLEQMLRRQRPALARILTEELTEVTARLHLPLPETFSVEEKAAFQLGYDQTRSRLFKEAKARKAQQANKEHA